MLMRTKELLLAEDGHSATEFSLFVGFLFLACAGFFCFSAGQFNEAMAAQSPAN